MGYFVNFSSPLVLIALPLLGHARAEDYILEVIRPISKNFSICDSLLYADNNPNNTEHLRVSERNAMILSTNGQNSEGEKFVAAHYIRTKLYDADQVNGLLQQSKGLDDGVVIELNIFTARAAQERPAQEKMNPLGDSEPKRYFQSQQDQQMYEGTQTTAIRLTRGQVQAIGWNDSSQKAEIKLKQIPLPINKDLPLLDLNRVDHGRYSHFFEIGRAANLGTPERMNLAFQMLVTSAALEAKMQNATLNKVLLVIHVHAKAGISLHRSPHVKHFSGYGFKMLPQEFSQSETDAVMVQPLAEAMNRLGLSPP